MAATLVLPSSIRTAARFAAVERQRGRRVVGASALDNDPYKAAYDDWAPLPYLHDAAFLSSLCALLETHAIDAIYTPHAPTHAYLHAHRDRLPPAVALLGSGAVAEQTARVAEQRREGEALRARVAAYAPEGSPLGEAFLVSLLSWSDAVYGECAEEKIVALCGIFASAPQGDIVEIGGFFGKSAFVLNRLAAAHAIGATLVVDPWDLGESVQHDSPASIQELSHAWRWSDVYDGFRFNLAAVAAPPFNYLRAPSRQAWEQYRSGAPVRTDEFGETRFCGKIAVLHIDGNHDEQAVDEDFRLWSQALAPAAWLIFDDYVWAHGDGPRRVADRVVSAYGARVRRTFTAGAALFLQLDDKDAIRA